MRLSDPTMQSKIKKMDNRQYPSSDVPPPPPDAVTSINIHARHPCFFRAGGNPFYRFLQQQQQQLQLFWTYQRQDIEHVNDFKSPLLPLARIKKIMRADNDIRMIAAEVPILFAKACELFILELTIRSWLHTEAKRHRILLKNDIAAAISGDAMYDFLVDIVPRDDETALGVIVTPTVSGVPYCFPSMERSTGPDGMMTETPAVDPSGTYVQPPSQAWLAAWQNSATDDVANYGGGEGSGQGHHKGQESGSCSSSNPEKVPCLDDELGFRFDDDEQIVL